jgi:hypothetical protein
VPIALTVGLNAALLLQPVPDCGYLKILALGRPPKAQILFATIGLLFGKLKGGHIQTDTHI